MAAFDNLEGDRDCDPIWVANVRDRLATWYAASARDLPWRVDRDRYRILVSERFVCPSIAGTFY
jgi:adenine-specific DNA glycosylase